MDESQKSQHTGHWQAPAGHWHEAPQLQVWSGPVVTMVNIRIEAEGIRREYDGRHPAITPPCGMLGEAMEL